MPKHINVSKVASRVLHKSFPTVLPFIRKQRLRVCATLQEAKITLVRLFQRYTFELAPGQVPLELRNTITLSPKNGVIVRPIPHKEA